MNVDDGFQSRDDTPSIFTRNMVVYSRVRVPFVNAADSAFEIIPVQDSAGQAIDSVRGNHWKWTGAMTRPLSRPISGLS